MLIETTDLPPLDISPVHVQITILPSESEYIAYVVTDMHATSIPIHLKVHDVKGLNTLLQEAIQQVASSFGNPAAYDKALTELSHIGNYAFQRIFATTACQETIRNALKGGSIIQIVAKDFFIPWELLCDSPPDASASISYYWGMNHIISRTIIQDPRPGALVSPVMTSKRPKVGLIASDRLPFVEKQEIPALKHLHQKRRIALVPLRELSMAERISELAALGQFLGQEFHIVHLACHAYEQEPIERSYLFITKDFPITMIDFVVGSYILTYHPLVILNACLTSVVNPLYTSSWAEKFWEYGARGVLATDFRVPDWFAASFSQALYQELLSGVPIGEALLTLRRQFWNSERNPMGLAYALYASPSIQIARAKNKKRKEIIE